MSYIKQAPSAVVMVRPHHFTSNPQTMLDNTFQSTCNSKNQ
ncbi:MAG: amidinotransferase, partial [Pseudoalteromonas tetraodonis]|nr:amidinotransferase [Pseudoalteromonas tetraodonis]